MQDLKIFDRIYLKKENVCIQYQNLKTPSNINEMFNFRQVNDKTTITRSCVKNCF